MSTLTEVMSKDVKKISSKTSIAETAKRMRDEKVGALCVEKDGELVGIVTDRDVVRRAVAEEKDLAKTPVETIMTTPLKTIDSTKTLLDAQYMMKDHRIRHLAVTDGKKVVGILSVGDLLAYFSWAS